MPDIVVIPKLVQTRITLSTSFWVREWLWVLSVVPLRMNAQGRGEDLGVTSPLLCFYPYLHTHTHTQAHTHKHTQARTHKHTRTHTHRLAHKILLINTSLWSQYNTGSWYCLQLLLPGGNELVVGIVCCNCVEYKALWNHWSWNGIHAKWQNRCTSSCTEIKNVQSFWALGLQTCLTEALCLHTSCSCGFWQLQLQQHLQLQLHLQKIQVCYTPVFTAHHFSQLWITPHRFR